MSGASDIMKIKFISREEQSDSENPFFHSIILRQDIRANTEKILYTHVLPGAGRGIALPCSIATDITNAIEKSGRDDPEVFDEAKDFVYQAMERDAFPGFLN
jgi:hypothetical protein